MIRSLGNRFLIIFLIIALLSSCNVAKKQIVPQDVEPETILYGLYNFKNIKSVKSVSRLPLNEISEIADDIHIYYQYAFLIKGAVSQQNYPIPDQLYVIAAIDNQRENGEMNINRIEGTINGKYALLQPDDRKFDVNVCYGKTKSECNPKKNPPYQVRSIAFELDKFESFKAKQKNIVDISVQYAFGKSKKELRGRFFSESGLGYSGERSVSFELPAEFFN
ncbi:hypothetical protein RJP21_11505 [Paenibacillus sp. VCA1]|uniref:hypothetical protein n=1 Tax=Paenibacillus sp. VCA1 TaxID=3039148 RepID=UPI0028716630|nr:hypothetical protein [Paenibacillus sp. VCA1]MDR9854228.1 hypothetical protein [Paenibacillus sp. VCA1]